MKNHFNTLESHKNCNHPTCVINGSFKLFSSPQVSFCNFHNDDCHNIIPSTLKNYFVALKLKQHCPDSPDVNKFHFVPQSAPVAMVEPLWGDDMGRRS